MTIPIYQIDAFAEKPFTGNPAAVCFPEITCDSNWLQCVAAEMNLSETAFLRRRVDNEFDLRWFTPMGEVDLCGHATLASAHALWESERLSRTDRAVFHTKSGRLSAELRPEGIVLDFPAEVAEAVAAPDALLQSLGVALQFVGKNRMDYLVEVETEPALRALQPDFRLMTELGTRGVIVTSRADRPEFDFVSRYFAPAFGIDEDPVTGSAHCCLGPFWRDRLGKNVFTAFQASRRGGIVGVRILGDRVELIGNAVTILRGELVAP